MLGKVTAEEGFERSEISRIMSQYVFLEPTKTLRLTERNKQSYGGTRNAVRSVDGVAPRIEDSFEEKCTEGKDQGAVDEAKAASKSGNDKEVAKPVLRRPRSDQTSQKKYASLPESTRQAHSTSELAIRKRRSDAPSPELARYHRIGEIKAEYGIRVNKHLPPMTPEIRLDMRIDWEGIFNFDEEADEPEEG
jgi:hypothetical protein